MVMDWSWSGQHELMVTIKQIHIEMFIYIQKNIDIMNTLLPERDLQYMIPQLKLVWSIPKSWFLMPFCNKRNLGSSEKSFI